MHIHHHGYSAQTVSFGNSLKINLMNKTHTRKHKNQYNYFNQLGNEQYLPLLTNVCSDT